MEQSSQKNKEQILEEVFGYRSFRPGQQVLIEAILQGRDTLGIMPTGAGKSICYQVPALCMPGITLVVSPLISLMKDQVTALVGAGVAAAYLNSSLTPGQQRTVLARAAAGQYKIIYVAPERLCTESFLAWAASAPLSMVTVDEAHCISQWGQDFRPSYLQIAQFIALLPTRPVVSAFTATATGRVKEDIIQSLSLRDPQVLVTGFDRPNLYFEVRQPRSKNDELLELMEEMKDKSGIVYCATRKAVEEVCELLQAHGYAAARYHAGLSAEEREKNQEDFLFDRVTVMAATNAFGMGIDKSNVSFVIHYNMPKNIESYYQEAGRAGRDGEPARCWLLYSGKDVRIQQFLQEKADEVSTETDEAAKALLTAQSQERLRQMTFYCTTSSCLRGFLLRYFGEEAPASCGNCGNCLAEKTDLGPQARQALALVQALEGSGRAFGKGILADILRGRRSDRVEERHLDELEQYGLWQELSGAQARSLLDQLVEAGALEQGEGEYPVLTLGQGAEALLAGGEFLGRLPQRRQRKSAAARRVAAAGQADAGLLEALKELRSSLAKERHWPAYMIFSDATLSDMAIRRPTAEEDFRQVRGVGAAKAEQFGQAFTQCIRAWLDEHPGPQLGSRLTVGGPAAPAAEPLPPLPADPPPPPRDWQTGPLPPQDWDGLEPEPDPEPWPQEPPEPVAPPEPTPAEDEDAQLCREVAQGLSLLELQRRHGGTLRQLCLRLARLELD